MARDHGRIQCAIWRNPDFLALSVPAQRAFMLLLSQPKLSLAGAIDYTPGRWATLAAGDTEHDLSTAIDELARGRFVIIDRSAEELLIRSFVRHDGVCDSPNLIQSMWKAWAGIHSLTLRAAVVAELPEKAFTTGFGSPKKDYEAPREALDLRSNNPLANPSPNPSATPSTFHLPHPPSTGAASASDPEPNPSPPAVPPSAAPPKTWIEVVEPNGPVAIRRLTSDVLARAEQAAKDNGSPLTPSERRSVRPVVEEALQSGYSPEQVTAAVAAAPYKTRNSVMGELRLPQKKNTSVGSRITDEVTSWVREEPA